MTWVGEKMRWPPSLAAAKRLATTVERGSERASRMLDVDLCIYFNGWEIEVCTSSVRLGQGCGGECGACDNSMARGEVTVKV